MADNLKVTHYNDGSEISYTSDEDWGSYDEGQYGIYDNDVSNADIYGNLYNLAVIEDDRGICPAGFHVPSDTEYTVLTDYLGGLSVAGGKMKENGNLNWSSPNTEATNESGFTGRLGGSRYSFDGTGNYDDMGNYGYFWSSSKEANNWGVWSRVLYYQSSYVYQLFYNERVGFSIRCLGD